MKSRAYNSRMRILAGVLLLLTALSAPCWTQEKAKADLSLSTQNIPDAFLWQRYEFLLQAAGGVEPYAWVVNSGKLPQGLKLEAPGRIWGTPVETGKFDITLLVTDKDNQAARRKVTIEVPNPLTIEWGHKASVNGQRIDGSIKVSNRSGRNFDLTFVVLAVNELGRATAIGYQHFPLKKNTIDMPLPFGDTLSPGNYAVNVDVVGEEPISKTILRARLVAPKETIALGP
jgi:hypothetical protein